MHATPWHFIVLLVATWLDREEARVIEYLKAERRVLLDKLGKKRLRFDDVDRKRLARAGQAPGRKRLRELKPMVNPDTIFRWYRQLIAAKYDGSQSRGPRRPGVMTEIRELVIRMAIENSGWGYTRIQGALRNLGHKVGRSTIRRILKREGLDPAPSRRRGMSWKTFIESHFGNLFALDFFTVEALTFVGLIRYHVLIALDVGSRRVHLCGIVHDPHDAWMVQIARNLTDAEDGFLRHGGYLIHDRDPLFSRAFRNVLRNGPEKIKPIRLPTRSPNLNAHLERFVLSIKAECLDRMVILGEAHLRHACTEYVEHYHRERNHQGLENRLILPTEEAGDGPVVRKQRLGGLLSYYHRKAA